MKKEKQARILAKRGKFAEAIDLLNEAAHDFQKNGDSEKAIEICEEGSSLARDHHKFYEGSFCERLLTEIHAQLGNRDACLAHLQEFRRMAKRAGSQSQEQVSFHVEAWCLQQLYTNGTADGGDLEEAVKALKTSMQLVDNFKKTFKDGDPAGSARIRKATMLILKSQILEQLGKIGEALEMLDAAEKFLSQNDKAVRYELRRTRCSMAPIERRIDIAELMDEEAPEDKKAQAICELSHHYIVSNRLNSGYQKLALAFIKHSKQLSAQEMEDLVKRLCILYRLVQYEKILKNSRMQPKISLCELHEAVGDLYDKYYQTMLEKEKQEYRHFVKANIVRNYEKMLEHKRNENDELRAYLALALVYGDLNRPSEALELFEKRLAILVRTGASEDKIIDTRISILDCMCKQNLPGLEPIFKELCEKVTLKNSRKELYDTWANYWADANPETSRKWRNEADKIPDIMVKNEDDETDVLYGRFSDEVILQKCVDENELLKLEGLSEYQRKKTNDKGETLLHLAAMENDSKKVEKLCRMNCEVNAKDHGGWTPLSEAVAHNRLENVKVLIRYGADVNARSAESFVSEESCESNETNHTRLTPLMDACTNGYADIGRTLIENRARIELKDSAGWTALDHLRHFMAENETDKSQVEFEMFLQKEMQRCNYPIKIPLSSIATSSRKNRKRGGEEEEEEDLDDSQPDEEEECMILDSVASRKRRISNNSADFGTMKRRPRSGENLRPVIPIRKRPHPPSSSSSARRSISPLPSSSSSSFQRHSVSPASRQSMSPTMTIRSAPSVIHSKNQDDDIQIVGVKRNLLRTHKSISPRVPPPVPSTPTPSRNSPRGSIAPPPALPPPPSSPQNDTIAVKCSFELPAGCKDKIHPVMLPMPRTLTIGETKTRVLSHLKSSEFKKMSVWKQDDVEKCLLDDELSLSLLPDRDLALVFQLIAPTAYEVYQETKDALPEVAERLRQFSVDGLHLDLSRLYLDDTDLLQMTRAVRKCERPAAGFRMDVGGCELSIEDESNLRSILPECRHLTITNTSSRTAFWELFEKSETGNLEILEMVGVEMKDETQIVRILEKCTQLKTLKLAGIQISNCNDEQKAHSLIPQAIRGLLHLKQLDLSFNEWISGENWRRILGGMDALEELTINEIRNDLLFQSDWLPSLRTFTARGSVLHWDSVCEMLSILENIHKIDVRYTNIDGNLVELLKNGTLEILA